MDTLAQIIAGANPNPYQTDPGISSLVSQYLLNQQMAPQQIGTAPQQAQLGPQQAAMLGSMGAAVPAATNPMALTGTIPG